MKSSPLFYCSVSIAPLRIAPDDRSEMVSQLLLGEQVEILERQKQWVQVRCLWDNYTGWMDSKQLQELPENQKKSKIEHPSFAYELLSTAANHEYFIQVPMAATLPHHDGLQFWLGNKAYSYQGQTLTQNQAATPEWITKIARRYLQAPYLWGGRSPMGLDCSGLTQCVYKMAGIALQRDASQQVQQGQAVHFLSEVIAGDLAFFENDKGQIAHVGLLISPDEIIHTYGWVRIDRIDHFGIFNMEQNKYTHRLRVIKRMLG